MSVYSVVLTIHSWMRWAALTLGVAATLNAYLAASPAPERRGRSRWDTFFMLAVDLQVLFGLFLYFGLSPFAKEGMNDLQAAIHVPALRFWTFTHITMMFGAALLVRVGRVMAMNTPDPAAQRKRRVVSFALALAIMAAGIPWPGTTAGRPLFRY